MDHPIGQVWIYCQKKETLLATLSVYLIAQEVNVLLTGNEYSVTVE